MKEDNCVYPYKSKPRKKYIIVYYNADVELLVDRIDGTVQWEHFSFPNLTDAYDFIDYYHEKGYID